MTYHPAAKHSHGPLREDVSRLVLRSVEAGRIVPLGDVEEWRPVPDYEGLYEVSNLGRVRSLHKRWKEPRLCYQGTDEHGYPTVAMNRDGRRTTKTVHRLVARAFHAAKQNPLHCEVAHLDGTRTNARADNLKWVSRCENESHKVLHGTRHSSIYSRLTEDEALAIYQRSHSGERVVDLGREFGVAESTVRDIKTRRHWRETTRAAAIAGGFRV